MKFQFILLATRLNKYKSNAQEVSVDTLYSWTVRVHCWKLSAIPGGAYSKAMEFYVKSVVAFGLKFSSPLQLSFKLLVLSIKALFYSIQPTFCIIQN